MRLLSDEELERSAVVANCRMNRERDLVGTNGYDKELGFDPLDVLKERARRRQAGRLAGPLLRLGQGPDPGGRAGPGRGPGRSRSSAWIWSGCSDRPDPGLDVPAADRGIADAPGGPTGATT